MIIVKVINAMEQQLYLMTEQMKRGVLLFIFLFAVAIAVFPKPVEAAPPENIGEINFYTIYTRIDDVGRSYVNLTFTFRYPEKQLRLRIPGRVENFEASSNAGPVNCVAEVSGITDVSCEMNLTWSARELRLSYETPDFVKDLDDKIYFSGVFTPNAKVSTVSATVKLPKNHFLTGEDISDSILTYVNNASAHILGDTIVITWTLSDITEKENIKFEVLYEQVKEPVWFKFRMRHFVLFGSVFAVVVGFVVVRYLRKSQQLVLSVLDEHERKIINIISEEGEIKQKKIVDLTNLSKAKVSRVVKSLASRGLIEVERRGRTNRIRLSKKKLKE